MNGFYIFIAVPLHMVATDAPPLVLLPLILVLVASFIVGYRVGYAYGMELYDND